MNAVEFTTELSGAAVLTIPVEIAADADWRAWAYQQFLRDDPQEDAIYDSCR